MEQTVYLQRRAAGGKVVCFKAQDGLHNNRVRFNGGYHDGAGEFMQYGGPGPIRGGKGWEERHHDPIYVLGWHAGKEDAATGRYQNNSEAAWEASGIAEGFAPYRI